MSKIENIKGVNSSLFKFKLFNRNSISNTFNIFFNSNFLSLSYWCYHIHIMPYLAN